MKVCGATKNDGEPCEVKFALCPKCGECFHHCDHREEERHAARRKGGLASVRKQQGVSGLDPEELPPLDSPQAAEKWLELIGHAVATGRLSASRAQAAIRAVKEWVDARKAGEVSEEVAAIREAMAEFRKTGKMPSHLKPVS